MNSSTVIHIGTVNLHAAPSGATAPAHKLQFHPFASYASALRGTSLEPDVVFDESTGLMWSKATIAKGKTWAEAKEAAAAFRLGDYTDWRLPTRAELLMLVDDTRSDPAIDTDRFECESAWYWTSTPLASSPSGYAWGVAFGGGVAGYGHQDGSGRVRAVRSVSSSASGQ